MEQSLNEIRHLLQTKIFSHPSAARFNSYSKSVLRNLSRCHTIDIGMHVYQCNKCQQIHYQYHSCGDRHCMCCGGIKREQWIQDRMSELLPTKYFHIVFTLPQELRSICMGNRKVMFNLIFECAHYTILKLSKDPRYLGATPGITSILHTNGQDLSFHPHVHSIVSGGGIDYDGKWIKEKRKNGLFLFPRRAMEKIYKSRIMHRIRHLQKKNKLQIHDVNAYHKIMNDIGFKKWNVYAKAPFGGPEQIIEYLGRYTHKVAITAHRILKIDQENITFKYKDYADRNQVKEMVLPHEEFLRRFEQHILPKRYVKIRHAGYLTHKNKNYRIADILLQFDVKHNIPKVKLPTEILVMIKTGIDITLCPHCNEGKLILLSTYKNHHGHLVKVDLHKNKGSPLIKINIP